MLGQKYRPTAAVESREVAIVSAKGIAALMFVVPALFMAMFFAAATRKENMQSQQVAPVSILSDPSPKPLLSASPESPNNSNSLKLNEASREERNQPSSSGKDVFEPREKKPLKSRSHSREEREIHVGPRGGRYHYSSSGKKVYERRKR